MDFRAFLLVSLLLFNFACTYDDLTPASEDENIIGQKLNTINSLNNASEGTSDEIVVYDEKVQKIHHFDVKSMQRIRSFDPINPSLKHYVLYSHTAGYTIDLSKKHLSVFEKDGNALHNPITFQGLPISAAFRPDLNYLVIYDDLMSVGMIKLNDQGKLQKSWLSGPLVENDEVITSGDITDSGMLVLSLSNNQIATVDLDASMNDAQWVFTEFDSPLENIKWVGPVRGQSHLILVKAKGKIAIVDLNMQTVVSEMDFDESTSAIEKYSKNLDPHIIYWKDKYPSGKNHPWFTSANAELHMVYVEGGELKDRVLFHIDENVMLSDLDLKKGTWMMVLTKEEQNPYYYGLNDSKETRRLVRYDFGNLLVTTQKDLPDKANLQLSKNFVFALYPSILGYAKRMTIHSDSYKETKLFNLPFLR